MRQVREDEQLGSVYLGNSNALLKVTEHLWVLILPKIFLLVSMKALD
jgi:hypothetical protein